MSVSSRMKMARICNYLAVHGSASMGEITDQLNIGLSTQYELFRAYKSEFIMLELKDAVWEYLPRRQEIRLEAYR